MFPSIGRVLLMGAVATATMDIVSTIARSAHIVTPLPPTLMGRWVAGIFQGQLAWLLMFPAMGFGLFGERGPIGTQLFLSSLMSHIAFGVGICLGARAAGLGGAAG
jgi:hypothetical protein